MASPAVFIFMVFIFMVFILMVFILMVSGAIPDRCVQESRSRVTSRYRMMCGLRRKPRACIRMTQPAAPAAE